MQSELTFDPPAKILSNEDFSKACKILIQPNLIPHLLKEKRTNELNEVLSKIEEYCRKILVDLTRDKDKAAKEKILEFLLKMDNEIPFSILARTNGFEIFGILFKLAYYDDHISNSVSNGVFEIYEH